MEDITCVINGAGSAGIAIAKHLLRFGVGDIILLGKHGIVVDGRVHMTPAQEEMCHITNKRRIKGGLTEAMAGADVFIGVSVPGVLKPEQIALMADKPIVLPMANPVPEIMPDEALAAGAAVVGTGRSDFPNQINNVLAFPGIFRGALDVRARDINDEMKMAASLAIASLVSDEELSADYIIPKAFDARVGKTVAQAVAKAAVESGVARLPLKED
jgi:malate dehydrogenase (oxaloacetate-decarboxylating)